MDASLALAGALIAWFSGAFIACARADLLHHAGLTASLLGVPVGLVALARVERAHWVGPALLAALVVQWVLWPQTATARAMGAVGLVGLALGLILIQVATFARRAPPGASPTGRGGLVRWLPLALAAVGAVPLVKLTVGAVDRARLREAFGADADSVLVAVSAAVFAIWAAGTWLLVRRNLVDPLVEPDREVERLEAWANGARDGGRSAWAFLASLAIGVASGLALALYLRQTR